MNTCRWDWKLFIFQNESYINQSRFKACCWFESIFCRQSKESKLACYRLSSFQLLCPCSRWASSSWWNESLHMSQMNEHYEWCLFGLWFRKMSSWPPSSCRRQFPRRWAFRSCFEPCHTTSRAACWNSVQLRSLPSTAEEWGSRANRSPAISLNLRRLKHKRRNPWCLADFLVSKYRTVRRQIEP